MASKKSLKILIYVAFILVGFQYWSLLTLNSKGFRGFRNASSSLLLLGSDTFRNNLFFVPTFPKNTSDTRAFLSAKEKKAKVNGTGGKSLLPLCPWVPSGLHGPMKVKIKDAPSLSDTEAGLFHYLKPGGRFSPRNCTSRHRVAIIVPYRDRAEHLAVFAYNIHNFLSKQELDYGIFIVEQAGQDPFNRAMLFNVGAKEALKSYDYQCFIFHDVDLIPEDDRNLYNCPLQPRHMSVAIDIFMYRIPYKDIFGGVSAMSIEHFMKVNGFSNSYWGWGGEDDDMFNRIRHKKLYISRYPANIARYKMLKHKKDVPNPERYKILYGGMKRIDADGYNSVKYQVLKIENNKLFCWIKVKLYKS